MPIMGQCSECGGAVDQPPNGESWPHTTGMPRCLDCGAVPIVQTTGRQFDEAHVVKLREQRQRDMIQRNADWLRFG